MRVVDRHRVGQLIKLSALERALQGPERLLREEDVAILVKAAYDDATPQARAAFMNQVKKYAESDWPWSAVAAGAITRGGGGGGKVIVAAPPGPKIPAALILLLGQADSPDADPGNRLPATGSPEAEPWKPLFTALTTWNTATIEKYIGPGGWALPGQTMPFEDPEDADTSGPPAEDPKSGQGPSGGQGGQEGQSGGQDGQGSGPPATTQPKAPGVPRWVWGLAIAGGAVLAVGTGVYLVRRRPGARARTLEEELLRQQERA